MYKIKFYKFVKQFLEVRKHFYQLHFWFPETNCSGFSEQFVFFYVYIEGENMSSLSENNLENKTNKHGRETTNNI